MRDYKLIRDTAFILSHIAKHSSGSLLHATGHPCLRDLTPSPPQLLSSFQRLTTHANQEANASKGPSNSDLDKIKESPFNLPNSLSLARGASGPLIAYLIHIEQWPIALAATAVSGATDWLDGYLARRYNQSGVLGSYLDPLGDKLLIGCLVVALAYKGLIPTWVASVVVGRDLALVGGLVYMRYRALRESRVRGERDGPITMSEFCRTTPAAAAAAAAAPAYKSPIGPMPGGSNLNSKGQGEALVVGAGAMPMMQPLFISKVNTVLQLGLIGGSLSHAWVEWPDTSSLWAIEVITAGTTVFTCAAYAHKALFLYRAKH